MRMKPGRMRKGTRVGLQDCLQLDRVLKRGDTSRPALWVTQLDIALASTQSRPVSVETQPTFSVATPPPAGRPSADLPPPAEERRALLSAYFRECSDRDYCNHVFLYNRERAINPGISPRRAMTWNECRPHLSVHQVHLHP